jgi:hypothetical protein
VWNLFYVAFVTSRILRWPLDFWEICAFVMYSLACLAGVNYVGVDLVNHEATFP